MVISRTSSPPLLSSYQQYKPLLRKDFLFSCAFCLSHERVVGDVWNMSVDHFKPKKLFPHLIKTYANLYYCCSRCNTYKGKHWPDEDERKAKKGFLDCCKDDPIKHYQSDGDGRIAGSSAKAKYTIEHLRLNRRGLIQRRRALAKIVAQEIDARIRYLEIRKAIESLAKQHGGSSETMAILQNLAIEEQESVRRLREVLNPSPLEDVAA